MRPLLFLRYHLFRLDRLARTTSVYKRTQKSSKRLNGHRGTVLS